MLQRAVGCGSIRWGAGARVCSHLSAPTRHLSVPRRTLPHPRGTCFRSALKFATTNPVTRHRTKLRAENGEDVLIGIIIHASTMGASARNSASTSNIAFRLESIPSPLIVNTLQCIWHMLKSFSLLLICFSKLYRPLSHSALYLPVCTKRQSPTKGRWTYYQKFH